MRVENWIAQKTNQDVRRKYYPAQNKKGKGKESHGSLLMGIETQKKNPKLPGKRKWEGKTKLCLKLRKDYHSVRKREKRVK